MATETRIIFPNTRVIYDQCVINAVLSVINLFGSVGVNHLDRVAVNHQRILFV